MLTYTKAIGAPLGAALDLLGGQPHWFATGDDWCAAAWHAAGPVAVRRVAILCPSIGQEHLRGQRDFRVLAERLAAAGVSTLRFDYPATGNSTGDAIRTDGRESDLTARWSTAIRDAVQHALGQVPGAEVILIGRRIGALLAARASTELPGGVRACVLWDPVLSGTAQLRELRLRESARLDVLYASELDRVEQGIAMQTEGHRFDAATVAGLAGMSLEMLCPHARTAHLVGAEQERIARAMARWCIQAGGPVISTHPTTDAAFDWSEAEGPAIPRGTFDAIEHIVTRDLSSSERVEVSPRALAAPVEIVLGRDGVEGVRVRLVRFGQGNALFGVLTSPAGDAPVRQAVLILGTGIEPSPGFGDGWARFTRSAAERGVLTLRMDYRGNGESVVRDDEMENVSYLPRRVDDVREGAAWLRSNFPGASIVVAGICTGGYYGIHAAAAGVPIDRVIAINPQLWYAEGVSRAVAPLLEVILASRSTAAVNDVGKWIRLLRGGYHLADVRRAVSGLAMRALASLPGWAKPTLGGGLPRLHLERLFPSNVPVHLVFSENDFGYEHLLAHGERPAKRLFARPHVRLHLLDGVDHTCSRAWMRTRLDEEVLAILSTA